MSTPFDQPEFGSQSPSPQEGSQGSAPQQSNQGNAPQGQTPPSVTDIGTLEKFRFGDREFTPDQLRKQMMLHQDYTRKTQGVAELKKYYDNLPHDLEKIKSNPRLAEEFKQVYPKSFHAFLNYLGVEAAQNQGMGQEEQRQQALDPQYVQKLDRLERYIKDQEVAKHEAVLEQKFSMLSKKYPDADEDAVLARAQSLLDQGVELKDQVWDKLWKNSHDTFQTKLQQKQKSTVGNQRAANMRANDNGSQGGTPGQAPQKMKLRQVGEYAISDIGRRKG